ncbi:ORF1a polyprotein [Air potato virus 1]|uniref:ORF1a polyprotein n=1 Tax=Air potato virus 1 TaxID=2491018 RepID=A0A3G6V9C9_9CLOS|nr:ORF1a polyprotein [Air potato virus 1]AZB50206.1 ORF1a polyprotein [Air potato virus 1]
MSKKGHLAPGKLAHLRSNKPKAFLSKPKMPEEGPVAFAKLSAERRKALFFQWISPAEYVPEHLRRSRATEARENMMRARKNFSRYHAPNLHLHSANNLCKSAGSYSGLKYYRTSTSFRSNPEYVRRGHYYVNPRCDHPASPLVNLAYLRARYVLTSSTVKGTSFKGVKAQEVPTYHSKNPATLHAGLYNTRTSKSGTSGKSSTKSTKSSGSIPEVVRQAQQVVAEWRLKSAGKSTSSKVVRNGRPLDLSAGEGCGRRPFAPVKKTSVQLETTPAPKKPTKIVKKWVVKTSETSTSPRSTSRSTSDGESSLVTRLATEKVRAWQAGQPATSSDLKGKAVLTPQTTQKMSLPTLSSSSGSRGSGDLRYKNASTVSTASTNSLQRKLAPMFTSSTPDNYMAPIHRRKDTLPLTVERQLNHSSLEFLDSAPQTTQQFVEHLIAEGELLTLGKRCFTTDSGLFVFVVGGDAKYTIPIPTDIWFLGFRAGKVHPEWLCKHAGQLLTCDKDTGLLSYKQVLINKDLIVNTNWSYMSFFDPTIGAPRHARQGWCWLKALACTSMPFERLPVAALVSAGYLLNNGVDCPVVKRGKHYHVDRRGVKISLLVENLVGAEIEEMDCDALTSSDARGNSLLAGALEAVSRRPVFRETSNVMLNLDATLASILHQTAQSKKRAHPILTQTLTEGERDYFISEVGDLYLEFRNGYRGGHSLLNAFRQVFNFKLHADLRGFTINSIGGSLAYHMKSDVSFHHVCSPILEGKDGARRWKDLNQMFLATNVSGVLTGDKMNVLCNTFCSSFCNRRLQDCRVPCTAMTAVDVYDIPLQDIVNAMSRKGTLIMKYALMFPPELLNRDGTIVAFKTDVTVTKTGDEVTYYVGSCGEDYTHSWSVIKSLILTDSIISDQGLFYSVEMVEQMGPYMCFEVALSSMKHHTTQPTRKFKAWYKDMCEIIVILKPPPHLRIERQFVERDFTNRFLLYLTNAAPSYDDRTFEYALSGLRAHRSTMIVGSKIIHSKIDIPTDLSEPLAATFLREAVNRRHQNRKSLHPFSIWSRFIEFLKRMYNRVKGFLKLDFFFKDDPDVALYNKLISKDEPLIRDCPDFIVEEIQSEVLRTETQIEIMEDIVETVRSLVLQQIDPPEEDNEEQVKERGGLAGGAKSSWFDFLLPKGPGLSEQEGDLDNFNLRLWRLLRKMTGWVNAGISWSSTELENIPVVGPILRMLFTFCMRFKTLLSTAFSYCCGSRFRKEETQKKVTLLMQLVTYSEKFVNFLKGVSSCVSNKPNAPGKRGFLSELGEFGMGICGAILSKPKEFATDFFKEQSRNIKHELGCFAVRLGVKKYEKWIKPTPKSILKKHLNKLLGIASSAAGYSPLLVVLLGGCYAVYNYRSEIVEKASHMITALKQYRLNSIDDAFSVCLGIVGAWQKGLPYTPLLNLIWKNPMLEGIFLQHCCDAVWTGNLSLRLLMEAYVTYPLRTTCSLISKREDEPVVPTSPVRIEIGVNKPSINKTEVVKQILAGLGTLGKGKPQPTDSQGEDKSAQQHLSHTPSKGKGVVVAQPMPRELRAPPVEIAGPSGSKQEIPEVVEAKAHSAAPLLPADIPTFDYVAKILNQEVGTNLHPTPVVEEIPSVSESPVLTQPSGVDTTVQIEPTTVVAPETVAQPEHVPSAVEQIYNSIMSSEEQSKREWNDDERNVAENIMVGASDASSSSSGDEAVYAPIPLSHSLSAEVKNDLKINGLDFMLSANPLQKFVELTQFNRQVDPRTVNKAIIEWILLECREFFLQCSVKSSLIGAGFVTDSKGKRVHSSVNREIHSQHYLLKYYDAGKDFLAHHGYLQGTCVCYSLPRKEFLYCLERAAVEDYPLFVLNYKEPPYAYLKVRGITSSLPRIFDKGESLLKITLTNAVPGGGKTYTLVENFKAIEGKGWVLTANRGSAEAIRGDIGPNNSWSKRVKTADSFIIGLSCTLHQPGQTVFVDECFLMHPGQLEACLRALQPSRVEIYGDRRQIPYINRVVGFNAQFTNLDVSNMEYKELLRSFRCPADVCHLLSTLKFPDGAAYTGPVKSVGRHGILKSVSFARDTTPKVSDLMSCDCILTFCQSEKHEMNELVRKSVPPNIRERITVRTVHEAQGATFKNILLVRTKWADDTVFSSLPHILVALSRHTHSLKYYCPATHRDKGVGKYVGLGEKLTEFVASQSLIEHTL